MKVGRLLYEMLVRPWKACDAVVLLFPFLDLGGSVHKPDLRFELICLACLVVGLVSSHFPDYCVYQDLSVFLQAFMASQDSFSIHRVLI